jgi:TonB family protein
MSGLPRGRLALVALAAICACGGSRRREWPACTERAIVTTRSPSASDERPRGRLELSSATRIIFARIQEVSACYESALRRNPGLQGDVRMAWTIAEDGTVSDVRIERSTLGVPCVTTCIRSAIRAWRFPRPVDGPVTMRFPFRFKPGPIDPN